MRTARKALSVLGAMLFAGAGQAKDYGIFVDGGYGVGQTEGNGLVDERIDTAKGIFDERHPPPGGESMRVDTKDAFKAYLNAIPCAPGDTITIVMMGHGDRNGFKFSLAASNRTLTAKELTDCLKAKHPECCIRVVIFACHSGSFIDDLFQSPNVKAVYTSCQAGEKSHSDALFTADGGFIDGGDWMKGFNEDWDAVPPGIDEGDALDTATESAWAKMPEAFAGKQTPAGWRRGELPVLAHVEQPFGERSGKAKLHFYRPLFMRCQTVEVKIDKDNANIAKNYKDCDWIEFTGRFGLPKEDGKPKDQIVMTDPPADAQPPQETIVGHIEGGGTRGGRKYLVVHVFQPNWLLCTRRTLWLGPGVAVSDQLRQCSFIQQAVTVDDPTGNGALSTTGNVEPYNWITPVVAHVEQVQNHRGRICVTIRHPEFLRFITPDKNKPAYLPVADALRATLESCDDIRVDLHVRQLGGDTFTGTDLREIDKLKQAQIGSFDAGVEAVMSPGFEAPLGEPMYPSAVIRNAGFQDIGACQLSAAILDANGTPFFDETIQLDPLPYDQSRTVQFSPWFAELPGDYTAVFSVNLGGDQNPDNNQQRLHFTVPAPVPPAATPQGWQSVQVGDPLAQPFFEVRDDMVAIEASGSGVAPTGDQFNYVFQDLGSDFALAAKLASGQLPPNQSGGLMVRGGPDPGAPFAALILNQNQLQFVVRPNPGAPPVPLASQAVGGPVWLSLERDGAQVSAWVSPDGIDFDPLGTHNFAAVLPDPAMAGLMAASPGFGPPVQFADVGGFPTGPAPLARPAALTARALDQAAVELVWSDESLSELGVVIERAEGDGPFTVIATLPPDSVAHIDGGLDPATSYTYRARYQTPFANEDWSAPATVETHGQGLAAWATANGIADPFADLLGDGTPEIHSYLAGRNPALFEPMALHLAGFDPDLGLPLFMIDKAPGVHDVHAELQLLDEALEWDTIHTLEAAELPGTYVFPMPFTVNGTSLVRLRMSSPPP